MSETLTPISIPDKNENGRLQIGVSWDTRYKTIETGFWIFKQQKDIEETYDLDLSCFIYDENKEILDMVDPDGIHMMDGSGQVYHSGDSITGRTEGDDEFISVNIKKLPENIHHIVFVIISADEQPFDKIANGAARVSDGLSEEEHLKIILNQKDAQACIFASFHRDANSPSGWGLKNISEFFNTNELSWSRECIRHI